MLEIPKAERTEYPQTFLDIVFIQVRFPAQLRVPLPELQSALKSEYPLLDQTDELLVAGGQIQTKRGFVTLLTKDRSQGLEIRNDRLTYVGHKYPGWREAFDRFKHAVEVVEGVVGLDFYTRVGVRYNNSIEKQGESLENAWQDFIRPEFISASTAAPFASAIVVSEHAMILEHEKANTIVKWALRSGRDSPSQRLELELDMFGEGDFDKAEAFSRAEEYHERLISLFEYVIQDKWRALMNREVRDD